VPKVVHAQLHLEALGRRLLREGHDSCVVDQQVDVSVGIEDAVSAGAHRAQRRQVQLADLQVRAGDVGRDKAPRVARLARVACRHHHTRPSAGQDAGDLEPKATVRAGDHGHATMLVGDVIRRPRHLRASFTDRRSQAGVPELRAVSTALTPQRP
jgi:hypothetical protein